MEYQKILIATEDLSTQSIIKDELNSSIYKTVSNVKDFKKSIKEELFDLLFIDLTFLRDVSDSGEPFDSVLSRIIERSPDLVIIVLCESKMSRSAIHALRAGAEGYLSYPVSAVEIRYMLDGIKEERLRKLELELLREENLETEISSISYSDNDTMRRVYESALSVSATDSTVLIMGETGVGKNVIAEMIHKNSSRKNMPFINVHCGAIPENLIESDLFGHERGSFTGAVSRKIGKFELADGGTIFLDEVGTMSMTAQIKLLKVLQEKLFNRVGSEKELKTDVRVIAAANRDLQELCEKGEFRQDLYYRLNVFPIKVPPLRERQEDIITLSKLFLKQMNQKIGKKILTISPQVFTAFHEYDWPGNIRELQNFIERAYILEGTEELTVSSFPIEVVKNVVEKIAEPVITLEGTLYEARQLAADFAEETYLREKLISNKGRINKTAEEAGISVRYLNKLMKKYGLRKESFLVQKLDIN